MGIVYLVEQDEPVRRRAALKVIQHAGDEQTREAFLSRFRSEGQLLARLKHPNIAVIYDAGQSDQGEPYLVLELLEGETIVSYCNTRRLDIRARLELFVDVCRGVQHAHQKGVIHRDLKPSNIIVTEEDGRPVAKIIDFGVAKEIEADSSMTVQGELLGSPGYMSPEMLVGGAREVDSRTDIYSLGAVLYQLLVDEPPFAIGQESFVQFLMRMVHEEPVEPSRRLRSKGSEATTVARLRAAEPESLGRSLTGDLDWITMKAMHKERDRRYATASELAEDVARFLDDRPVEASPLGRWYRIRKTARRHRVGFAIVIGLALSLVAATVTTSVALIRATKSERRAVASELSASREAERTRVVNAFLEELLGSMDPSRDGRDVKLIELVNRKTADLERRFAGQPEIEASIRHIVGTTYLNLGEYDIARLHLGKAVEARTAHLGPAHRSTLESRNAMARLLLYRGEFGAAVEMGRDTLAECDRAGWDRTDPLRLKTLSVLGESLYKDGSVDDAYEVFRSALAVFEPVLGRDDPDVIAARSGMALALKSLGRVAEAEAIYRVVLEQSREVLGADNPATLQTQNALANTLFLQERYDEAEALYRSTYKAFTELLGKDHKASLLTLNNIGNVLYKTGRYEAAEATYRRAVEAQESILGREHPDTLVSLNNLANALRRQRRFDEAEALYRRTLAAQTELLGPAHVESIRTALNLASVLYETGRFDEVVDLSDRMIRHRPDLEDPVERKAEALLAAGRFDEAVAPSRDLVERFPDRFGPRAQLAFALLMAGRSDEAKVEYTRALELGPTSGEVTELSLDPLIAASRDRRTPAAWGDVESLLRSYLAR